MKTTSIPAALALGFLIAGGAFAAPPSAYQGGPEKKDEAVKQSEKTGQPDKPAQDTKSVKPTKNGKDTKDGKDGKSKPEEKKGGMTAATFAGLELRNIGPAAVGGRIIDIAVDPRTPSTWYVAAASGGIWKTTNAGTTWDPIFEGQGSFSIGCLTLDPRNPLVLWVGTGEKNSQRSVSYGDGVYKSTDGGKSWENVGLKKSEHIGRILIDPRDSNTVYVAAQGPLWSAGGDRGLYKTTDGGKTWKAVLSISENTGVSDVALDPRNPDVLYAAAYQRRRHIWTLIDGGPESGVEKSTDGGATWKKLGAGLPKGVDVGRIGLAVAPTSPDTVYAIVEAAGKSGGFFRSTDGGGNWAKQSDTVASSPQYYQTLYVDPQNADRVYSMDVFIVVTDDGGKDFHPLGEKDKHVDNHALWIDPANRDHLLDGCDGGLYESWDRGGAGASTATCRSPSSTASASTTQNRSITSSAAPRTTSASAARRAPPTTTASATPTGSSPRAATASSRRPIPRIPTSSTPRRSTAPSTAMTSGRASGCRSSRSREGRAGAALELGRTADHQPALPHPALLRRQPPVPQRRPRQLVERGQPRPDPPGRPLQAEGDGARLGSRHGGLQHLDLDLRQHRVAQRIAGEGGLIYAGTDDGLIQISEDGGAHWRKIDRFPGIPDDTYVSDLEASPTSADTVYAAFNNHQMGDFRPYLLRSTDRGKSWTSIAGDLPERGSVWTVAQDFVDPDLLFAGTEFGLYFTRDGGKKWIKFDALPVIPVRDLALHRKESDLVVATFGRGFWILDDYSLLRNLKPAALEADAALFPVHETPMYLEGSPLGLPGKGFTGAASYTAENPPFGAIFTYYLKDDVKSLRKQRQEAEKKVLKEGGSLVYPAWETLRREEQESEPTMLLVVKDEAGNVVRRLPAPAKSGFHRVAWDLHWPPSNPIRPGGGRRRGADPDEGGGEGPEGPLAAPGKYTVSLLRVVDDVATPVGQPQAFAAVPLGMSELSAQDQAAQLGFQRKTAQLQRAVLGAVQAVDEARTRLGLIRKAILQTPKADLQLTGQVRQLDLHFQEIQAKLTGDPLLAERQEATPPAIVDRIQNVVGGHWSVSAAATRTWQQDYDIAAAEFAPVLEDLRKSIGVDLKGIEDQLESLGAPWTPGRLPTWTPQ